MKLIKYLTLAVMLCALLVAVVPARADVAPPANPPGANPDPGGVTQVRMEKEVVTIEVLAQTPADSLGRAHVTAYFWMRNLGTATETLAVRYPAGASDGWSGVRRVENLSIKVDEKVVETRETTGPDPRWPDFATAPWVEFDVTFPPGEEVKIKVSYDLEGTGYPPEITFDYVLSTGAGWNGTIGLATIILRLPYDVDPLAYEYIPPFGLVNGRDVQWTYEQLEPERVNDLTFTLIMPARWQAVLAARAAVARDPNDGEAWGRLGKAYKDVFMLSKGYRMGASGEELYRNALEAYQTCLRLKPEDAQWHAGYADLLANHAFWSSWEDPVSAQVEQLAAIEELHTALQLAPNDGVVQRVAADLAWALEPGMIAAGERSYEFPWLTATPPAPTPFVPTETPQAPLATPTLSADITALPYVPPTAAPQPSGSAPCGSALLLLLPAGLVFWRAKRREA